MVARRRASEPHANRLLGLLPPRDYQRLRPHLHRIPLVYKQSLYRAKKPIEFVYFIETGVGSLVNTMKKGDAAEVGTIGNEGVVGLPIVFGDNRAPTNVYVQVPGVGLRMKATLFEKKLRQSDSMRTVMLHYAHAFFNQVAQSAACNHFHSLEQRCCRWLLMTHDRMHSDEFLLTQEFLAMMLGVQRTGVTAAAGALQRAGLIRYKRGNVTILNRRGLIQGSCECYGVSKREFDRLLGNRAKRKARAGAIMLETFERLKMAYPKTSAKRREELQAIREQLAK
jgi:CRP-like cAMP-binding protein